MYLTNQQLISQRKDGGGDLKQLASSISTIFALVKKYGPSALKGTLFGEIQKVDATLSDLILLLDATGKLKKKSLGVLHHELGGGATDGYIVKSNNPDTVEGAITPSADKVSSKKIEVQISGDGKIYKRGLEGDLGKMLS